MSGALGDSTTHSTVITRAIQNTDLKLMLIPAVFIFFRIWGSIRYIASTVNNCKANHSDGHFCVSKDCYYALYSFTFYLQVRIWILCMFVLLFIINHYRLSVILLRDSGMPFYL